MQLEPLILPLQAKDEISGIVSGIVGKVAGLIAIAGAAAVAFGTKAFLEAARVDELAAVNMVLAKNAGIAGSVVKAEAEEVRKMGIEAASAQQVVARFVQNQLDLSKASELARVAQDAAVIAGLNSTETTDRLIHGITTLQPEVLRTAGIIINLQQAYKEYAKSVNKSVLELTYQEKQQIALNETLKAGEAIAGSYEAAMKEPAKVLRSMPRYINDIFVSVGHKLKPAFGELVFAVADFTKGLGKALEEGGALEPLVARIGLALTPFGKMVREFVENIDWSRVARSLEPFVQGFVKLAKLGESILSDGIGSAKFMGALEGIGKWASKTDVFIGNILDNLTEGVNKWMKEGGPEKLSASLVSFFEGIGKGGEFKSKALEAADKLVQALATALGEVDWVAVQKAFDDALGRVIDNIPWDTLGDKFGSFIEDLVTSDGIQFVDSSADDEVGKAIAEFFTNAIGPKNIANWEQFSNALDSALTSGISRAVEVAIGTTPVDRLQHLGRSMVNSLITGFVSNIPGLSVAMAVAENLIESRVRETAKVFFNAALAWTQQMIKGFSSGIGGLLAAISGMVGQINGVLKKIITSFNIGISFSGVTSGSVGGGNTGSSSLGSLYNASGTGGAKKSAPKPIGGTTPHGGRASGGPVLAAYAYGINVDKEWFVPNQSGTVEKKSSAPQEISLSSQSISDFATVLARVLPSELQKVRRV